MVSDRRLCFQAIACGRREASLAPRRAFVRSRELGLLQLTSAQRRFQARCGCFARAISDTHQCSGLLSLAPLTTFTPVRGKLSCAGTARVLPDIAAGRLMPRAHGPRRATR